MAGPILLLDNRDSFVWNLAQAFQVLGQDVSVVRSDRIRLAELRARRPGAIVLSPGPGRPEGAGVCVAAVRALSGRLPILGVCLGHQAIGVAHGARLRSCPPCHGKAWEVEHRARGLFTGLPSPLRACRYHSLAIDARTLPPALRAEAWTPQGELMALRHREHPTWGVQFHPESFRTDGGLRLLENFLERRG